MRSPPVVAHLLGACTLALGLLATPQALAQEVLGQVSASELTWKLGQDLTEELVKSGMIGRDT